jgi:hypothetical protein
MMKCDDSELSAQDSSYSSYRLPQLGRMHPYQQLESIHGSISMGRITQKAK